jgi:hypothetical protein
MFSMKKWAFKKIDRIHRSFLWKGSANAQGGHSLVRWERVKRPKYVGVLGVLDLEMFSRALRLRWLWYEWMEPDRPWFGADVPCSEVDRQLFRVSTVVKIGNGQTASFWSSSWLNGRAPRDIAPNLFKLAWCKKNSVAEDLQNDRCTRGLWRINNSDQITEFIHLWGLLQDIQLNGDPESISWC